MPARSIKVWNSTSSEWEDVAVASPDTSSFVSNALVNAKGDLITATADDTPARLAVGTNGQVLKANSATATGLEWAAEAGIPATLIDAKGDLIAGSAADTAARLAVGTNGYVLQAASGQSTGLQWAGPVDLGAWTSYTPTWTNLTIGNATVSAKYQQIGKMVDVVIEMVWGSTTSATDIWYPSLPVSIAANSNAYGCGFIFDTSALVWNVCTYSARNNYWITSASGRVSNTVPWTWASGDYCTLSLTYQAA